MKNTWSTDSIPALTGKNILVTGGNSGLGLQVAMHLAAKGAHVIITSRSIDKGADAVKQIHALYPHSRVDCLQLDLADLNDIRRFSNDFHERYFKLDRLINNAGVMFPTQRMLTIDGFEVQFGTNHLGHFALTGLLLDLLKAVPGSRISTQSSIAHTMVRSMHLDNLQGEKQYSKWRAYSYSKLANLLFTFELNRRLKSSTCQVIANAAHPGISNTNLFKTSGFEFFTKHFVQAADKGCLPVLRAAFEPGLTGGEYFGPDGIAGIAGNPVRVTPSTLAKNADLALKLWDESVRLTGINYRF